MPSRISKHITNQSDIDEILAVTEKDVTTTLMMEFFGEFNEKQRFHPYDTFIVPKGAYGKDGITNDKPFKTTIGLWIFNRYMIEPDLLEIVGYVNYEVNSKAWGNIVDKVTRAWLEDDLPDEKPLDRLLQKSQKLMPMCTVLTPSVTDKFLNVSKYIEPEKKRLAKKYEKELAAGDAITAEKMEQELIKYALDYLGDDPSLDIYLSGARSTIENHFKNMYIMKGAIRNPDPNAEKQFNIALSNYNDGISKDEYSLFCNSLSAGPYKRAKKTEIGGYWEKLFVAAYQHLTLDKPGSDCGTKDTIKVLLTKDNISDWLYSYIKVGNDLIELNSKNMDKYIGKEVNFRFAAMCESKTGFCNKCVGNLFYKLKMNNIGVSVGMIASVIKNKSMKAFHDSTEHSSVMDPKKAFGE